MHGHNRRHLGARSANRRLQDPTGHTDTRSRTSNPACPPAAGPPTQNTWKERMHAAHSKLLEEAQWNTLPTPQMDHRASHAPETLNQTWMKQKNRTKQKGQWNLEAAPLRKSRPNLGRAHWRSPLIRYHCAHGPSPLETQHPRTLSTRQSQLAHVPTTQATVWWWCRLFVLA